MKIISVFIFLLFISSCTKAKGPKTKYYYQESFTQVANEQNTEPPKKPIAAHFNLERYLETEEARERKFNAILSTDNDFETKVHEATTYFNAFEFHFWTQEYEYDNQETYEKFLSDSTTELNQRLKGLFKKISVYQMSPLNDPENSWYNNDTSFYALAVAMGSAENEKDSFYTILKDALKKEYYRDELRQHEKILITEKGKEIIIELIKARVDMFTALALAELHDDHIPTFRERMRARIYRFTRGRFGSIRIPDTYSRSNFATKEMIENNLIQGLEAKEFLKSIGQEKELDERVWVMLNNVNLEENDLNNSEPERTEAIRILINQLLGV